MLCNEKQLENLSLKVIFWFCWFLQEKGCSCWSVVVGGGDVTTNQRDIVPPPPPFNLSRKTSLIGLTLVSCTKMDFVFVFVFSLGLGLGSRVRIKMWMMWNNTRPPLYQCWTHNFSHWHSQTNKKHSDLNKHAFLEDFLYMFCFKF